MYVAGRNPASRRWPDARNPNLIEIAPAEKRRGPHYKRIPIPAKPAVLKRRITK